MAAEDGLFVVLLGVTLAAGVGVTVLRGRFSGTRHLSLQPRGALGLDAIRGGVSSSSHSWPFV